MAQDQPILRLYVQDAVDEVVHYALVLQPLLELERVDLQQGALLQAHDELGFLLGFDEGDGCWETREGDSLEGLNRAWVTMRFM